MNVLQSNQKVKKISLNGNERPAGTPLLQRILTYLQEQSTLWIILGGIIATVLGGSIVWHTYRERRELAAQAEIWTAEAYLRIESYELALEGGRNDMGLLELIEQYGDTKAGNLAYFYAGLAYLEIAKKAAKGKPLTKEQYEKALDYLERFDGSGTVMELRSWALLGGIYCDLKEYEKALSYYLKAANNMRNAETTPGYLMQAASLYEELEQYDKALNCYEDIYTSFPFCEQAVVAKKLAEKLKQERTHDNTSKVEVQK